VKRFFEFPVVALIALTSGCAGSTPAAPVSMVGAQSLGHLARPLPLATGGSAVRVGLATPLESRIVRRSRQVLVAQSFAGTSATGWVTDQSCLTAGKSSKRKGSIPACGSKAPRDAPGGGALELTGPVDYTDGLAGYGTALPTANGLEIVFDYYSFDGTGADGSLVYLTDGSQSPPQKPGSNKNCGGCLGYVPISPRWPGLPDAYLGVGLDEYGDFGRLLPGGPGQIGQTIYLGGAQSIGYAYLGGVVNNSGQQVSLPFDLDEPQDQTRPTTPLTFYISITAAGLVEVAIDIHDGNGPVTYVSENIVGVAGQPAVPPTVYVGFIGSCGGYDDRHQLNNLEIETLQ
jgi:hypothetical protein